MNLDHEPVWLSAEAALVEDWVINLDAGRSMLMVRLQEKCFLHPITHIRFLLGSPPYVVSASGCLTHLAWSSDCMWFWISLPLASCRDLNQRRKDMSSLFTQKCKYYLKPFFLVINYVLNYVLYRSIKGGFLYPSQARALMSLIYETPELFMSKCCLLTKNVPLQPND